MNYGSTWSVRAWLRAMIAVSAVFVVFALPGHAQDHATLARILGNSSDFRVRVQAAFALGNTRDVQAIGPLQRALRDSNPAVRAAAATALGRVASPTSLPALQRARRDNSAAVRLQVRSSIRAIQQAQRRSSARLATTSAVATGQEPSIPWPRIRYVVTVGDMRNRSGFGGDAMSSLLRDEVGENLRNFRDIAVMPNESISPSVQREIRRRRLPSLRLDGSVTRVERRLRGPNVAVRCEVSLVLTIGSGRAIRGELRGAATGMEPGRGGEDQVRSLAERALSGAVRSALSSAPQALARAAAR